MSRVTRTFRHIGVLLKILLTVGIALVCGFLFWRIFIAQEPPKELDHLTPNDALYQLYEQEDNDLTLMRQKQNTITRAEKNKGYFAVPDVVFIPDADQIQVLFRYNNSTIRALVDDNKVASLEELPARTDRIYDVTLVLNLDLTPNVTSDNAKTDPASVRQVCITATTEQMEQKYMYNYTRLVFDMPEDLDLSAIIDDGTLLAVFADVYYTGDLDYNQDPYGTLCLYDYKSQKLYEQPKSADWAALKEYGKRS